jgi:hypothetical protein
LTYLECQEVGPQVRRNMTVGHPPSSVPRKRTPKDSAFRPLGRERLITHVCIRDRTGFIDSGLLIGDFFGPVLGKVSKLREGPAIGLGVPGERSVISGFSAIETCR